MKNVITLILVLSAIALFSIVGLLHKEIVSLRDNVNILNGQITQINIHLHGVLED